MDIMMELKKLGLGYLEEEEDDEDEDESFYYSPNGEE